MIADTTFDTHEPMSPRDQAQDLMWTAMDLGPSEDKQVEELCRQALSIYPDCVDAMIMLAEMESTFVKDYVDAMRKAVAAGRRDVGPKGFKELHGHFWGVLETRPFMRAMAGLAEGLTEWGTPAGIDEAIGIYEEMLDLNPNDNQGVRTQLVGCYLSSKRYGLAEALLERYDGDCSLEFLWAEVLLAFLEGDEEESLIRFHMARKVNPYVELYLSSKKRRPRVREPYTEAGSDAEAVYCADAIYDAWNKHPKAKRWLKALVSDA